MEILNTNFTKNISTCKEFFVSTYENYIAVFLISIVDFLEKHILNNNIFKKIKHKEKFIRSYTILNERYRKVGTVFYLKSFNFILKDDNESLKSTFHLDKNSRAFLDIYPDIFKNFKSILFQFFIQSKLSQNKFISFFMKSF